MKKILYFLLVIPSLAFAQLELPYSVKVLNPYPLDAYYFNQSQVPYTSTAQVISQVGAGVRYRGQKFNVNGVEYCFCDGTADGNLEVYLPIETDPVYSASSWFSTTNNSANWNTAYSWGNHASAGYQPSLVSGTNIKTINSTSLLGSGNISVQAPLVSGTNIKTVNGNTLLGSGDLSISAGVSNSATIDELMKSNGTNAVSSGIFSTSTANLNLGSPSTSGSQRSINVFSNSANANLVINALGTGYTRINSSDCSLDIGAATGTAFQFTANRYTDHRVYSSNTNTPVENLRLRSQSLGTEAPGFGTAITFENGDNTSPTTKLAEIAAITVTPDVAGDLKFSTADGGVVSERFRISNKGALGVNGNFGTSGQYLRSAGSGAPPTWANIATLEHTYFQQNSPGVKFAELSVSGGSGIYSALFIVQAQSASTSATDRTGILRLHARSGTFGRLTWVTKSDGINPDDWTVNMSGSTFKVYCTGTDATIGYLISAISETTDLSPASSLSLVAVPEAIPGTGTNTVSNVIGLSTSITTLTSSITLNHTHSTVLVDATSASRTITLPLAANFKGIIFRIKRIDNSANSVTIDPNGVEQIEFLSTKTLAPGESVTISSDGTQWLIL